MAESNVKDSTLVDHSSCLLSRYACQESSASSDVRQNEQRIEPCFAHFDRLSPKRIVIGLRFHNSIYFHF